jgi:hypothetical protein
MFGVAAAALLLLFIGIHNSWDAVTYHVFVNRGREVNERPRLDVKASLRAPCLGVKPTIEFLCGDLR